MWAIKYLLLTSIATKESRYVRRRFFCVEKYADRLTTELFSGRMAITVDDPWDSHAFVRRNTDEVYLTREDAEAKLKEREQNGTY